MYVAILMSYIFGPQVEVAELWCCRMHLCEEEEDW